MAQATPQQVIDKVQETLHSNIEDPNPDRRSDTEDSGDSEWIYTIPIRFDIADYPRIHLQDISSTHEGLSIGSTERWMEHRFQITVFHSTEPGYKLDVDGDDETESINRVVDFVADRVVEEVNDNQSVWRGIGDQNNVYSVLTEGEQRLQDEDNGVIQHTVDCIIKMSR